MELYINGTQIELPPSETISLDKSVGRIGQIATRSGVVSVDFDVPETASNIAALGYNDRLETEPTVSPSDKQPAYIEDQGHEVARGFVQIVSWDHANRMVSITFFGGNTNWFELLRGKYIDEADLSAWDHTWTEANITGSWTNTEGYIYPTIDYGRLTGQILYYTYIDDWYPAIYQHSLLKMMFRAIGYKIAGAFTNTFAYKNAIIPFSRKEFIGSDIDLTGSATDDAATYTHSGSSTNPTPTTDTDVINIETIVRDPSGAFSTVSDNYTAPQAITNATFRFSFPADLSITVTSGGTVSAEVQFQVRKNSTAFFTSTLLSLAGSGPASVSDSYIFTVQTDLAAGDVIDAVFFFTGTSGSTSNISFSASVDSFAFELLSTNAIIPIGGNIAMSNILPEVSQTDFVRDMIVRHNLLVTSDNITGTVYFNPFSLLYSNMGSAVDWSDKVDLSGVRLVDFTESVKDFGKNTIFEYAAPGEDDIYLQDYNAENDVDFGAGILEIENDFIADEKVVHTSPFAPTFTTDGIQGASGSHPLPHIPRFDYSGSENGLESKPRILYVAPDTPVSDFAKGTTSTNLQIDGTQYTETAYAWFAKPVFNTDLDSYTDNLCYDLPVDNPYAGSGLLSDNYTELGRILNKPRYLEISVRLWPQEFRELDFTVPVYINAGKVQGYFYINEVEGYEGERKPVTAKLVQLI